MEVLVRRLARAGMSATCSGASAEAPLGGGADLRSRCRAAGATASVPRVAGNAKRVRVFQPCEGPRPNAGAATVTRIRNLGRGRADAQGSRSLLTRNTPSQTQGPRSAGDGSLRYEPLVAEELASAETVRGGTAEAVCRMLVPPERTPSSGRRLRRRDGNVLAPAFVPRGAEVPDQEQPDDVPHDQEQGNPQNVLHVHPSVGRKAGTGVIAARARQRGSGAGWRTMRVDRARTRPSPS